MIEKLLLNKIEEIISLVEERVDDDPDFDWRGDLETRRLIREGFNLLMKRSNLSGEAADRFDRTIRSQVWKLAVLNSARAAELDKNYQGDDDVIPWWLIDAIEVSEDFVFDLDWYQSIIKRYNIPLGD